MHRRIYLDNAATSHPKPSCVQEAMVRYASAIGASPGRGAYRETREAESIVAGCRGRIADLLNAPASGSIIFTLNCTDALNLAIKGIVARHQRAGRPVHVVATDMDHNSILRPLNALAELPGPFGIKRTFVGCDRGSGLVDPDAIAAAIGDDTRLVCITHASNVSGTVQPLGAIADVCRRRDVPLLVDAAQSLGHLPLDAAALGLDLVAFPGHKGLLGPLGTGGLYMTEHMDDLIEPLREGGTGSRSDEDIHPRELPDRYEPGSPNAIGIAGLDAGVGWLLARGIDSIAAHERGLLNILLPGLRAIDGVHVVGPVDATHRCGVVSFAIHDRNPHDVADELESFGVLARAGLHCAPRAHRALCTTDRGGTVRLSLGPFIEPGDVQHAVHAVERVAHGQVVTA